MRDFRISRFALAVALAGTTASIASPAYAQAQPDAAAPQADAQDEQDAAEPTEGFGEMVVTARRFVENLQDAPVAVSAFGEERLQEIRPTNLATLSSLAPNLIVTPATGAGAGGNIFIRGIGQNDPSPYLDAPTSVYINGVIRARTSLNLAELGDIDRIEVLRGPQGTLFGRNTTGGAINIFTPKPTEEMGLRASLGVGTDDELVGRLTFNSGELGNSGLRVRLSGFHREIGGVVENPGVESSLWAGAINADGFDVRVTGDWGRFHADYQYDYTFNESSPYNQQITFFLNQTLLNYFNQSPGLGGGALVISPTRLGVQQSRLFPLQTVEAQGHSLTLTYDLTDDIQLKSITGLRDSDESRPHNSSSQPLLLGRVVTAGAPGGFTIQEVTPLQTPIRDLQQDQFSQEIQLLGSTGDLNWALGFFYFEESFHELNENFNTSVNAAGLGVNRRTRRDYTYETESWAGFAQVTWRPSSLDGRLDLTAGIRYTEDTKAIDDFAFTDGVQTRRFVGEDTFNNVSGLFSVGYKFTDDVLGYIRLATGYKAGGFVPGSAFQAFEPETVASGEIGFKTTFWDRLRLNVAAFYSEYTDLQISGRVADPITGVRVSTLTNAGAAHYTGAEVEASLILGGGFSVDGVLGYTEPVYDQFPFFDGTKDINVANEARFPYVSNLTYDVGMRYNRLTSIGEVSARINYQYQSERYFFALTRINPNNDRLLAPGQGFMNARLSLDDIPLGGAVKNLRIELYVDNILDDDRILGSIDSTNYGSTFFGRGRQGGIELTIDF